MPAAQVGMTDPHWEAVPAPQTNMVGLLLGVNSIISRAIELGVDYSGDQELAQAWYRNMDHLPLVRHVNMFGGVMGLLGFSLCLIFAVPKALWGILRHGNFDGVLGASPCPLLLTLVMLIETVSALRSEGGGPPAADMVDQVTRLRWQMVLVSTCLISQSLLSDYLPNRHITKLLRPAAAGKALAVKSTDGVPEGMELVDLVPLAKTELLTIVGVFNLCMFDLGIQLRGDQALTALWLAKRHSLPVVKHAWGVIAAAACLKLVLLLGLKVPRAIRGEEGARIGCAPLLLAPVFAWLHGSAAAEAMLAPIAIAAAKTLLCFAAFVLCIAECLAANRGATSGAVWMTPGEKAEGSGAAAEKKTK